MNKQELIDNGFYIMIHETLNHLNWVCSLNDENQLESTFLNKNTKEVITKSIDINDFDDLVEKMKSEGWIKGYLPQVNFTFAD